MGSEGASMRAANDRALWLGGVLLALLGGLSARLWCMQVRDHAVYNAAGDQILVRSVTIPAARGVISDCRGRPLAMSKTMYTLRIDPTRCTRAPEFYAEVARAASLEPAVLNGTLAERTKFTLICKDLSEQQMKSLRSVAKTWRADGVSLEPELSRVYPNSRLASAVLGFVNDFGQPQAGLELALNKSLCGKDGVVKGPTDGSGFILPLQRRFNQPAQPGKDVRLTIDLETQQAVTEALQDGCKLHTPATATAIVMDPHTGDIRAMVSLPDYDPNDPRADIRLKRSNPNSSPLRNSCVSLAFPPGSVFKVLTIAAALQSGAITPDTQTYCSGSREFGGRTTSCAAHEGSRAHGQLNPLMVMTVSCNLSAGIYALKMGPDTFIRYIHDFGCLDKPGLGLRGETRGLLPAPTTWGNPEHQLATMGFGQSISITPVGLATALTAFVNDGQVVRPRLISQIGNERMPVRRGKRVVSPQVAREIREMMTSVVEHERGTGHQAAVPGFHVGGKTGTAQKPDPVTHLMSHSLYDSYFAGLVPSNNPRAVVVVMFDEPHNGYYGGAVAAPVFKKIANYLVTKWRLTPDAPIVASKKVAQ